MKEDIPSKTLTTVFTLSSWLGITFKKSNKKQESCFLSLWDSILFVCSVVSSIISIYGIHLFRFSQRLIYIVYAYLLLGVLIRLTMTLKRKQIFRVENNISYWCNKLNVDSQKQCKLNKIYVSLIVIWIISISVTFMLSLMFIKITDDSYVTVLGFQVAAYKSAAVLYLIRISCVFSGATSTGIIFLILIICTNTYAFARKILKSFSDYLKSDYTRKLLSKSGILSYVSTYRNLINLFKDMDNVLSSSCLLIYAAAIICFFSTVSILFSDVIQGDLSMFIEMITALLMAIVLFFSLTFSATNVTYEYDKLKFILLDGAEKLLTLTDNEKILSTYRMFFDSVMSIRIYFTGAGMFEINKGLILTTAGALITYGVMVFQ